MVVHEVRTSSFIVVIGGRPVGESHYSSVAGSALAFPNARSGAWRFPGGR
ncbi:hypothetical protein SGM_4071 [Streptomyces griseoaurantiacus M045]|uniref:Uncharacterized protein n=1 Tax=Streptomyces griseoaurantiacus M045 TaxID=996637 RepID=F3NLQ7_9ACTN|nr:hypothetical protein SGM_4071 [Streptomyces griseoaurantiacus M045]